METRAVFDRPHPPYGREALGHLFCGGKVALFSEMRRRGKPASQICDGRVALCLPTEPILEPHDQEIQIDQSLVLHMTIGTIVTCGML